MEMRLIRQLLTMKKRALKQRIHSIFDDKMRYASTRLVEEMCVNEAYALEASGNLQDLENVTAASLYTYYQKALSEDEIDVYVMGMCLRTKWSI